MVEKKRPPLYLKKGTGRDRQGARGRLGFIVVVIFLDFGCQIEVSWRKASTIARTVLENRRAVLISEIMIGS
jgi:hypothetical protein